MGFRNIDNSLLLDFIKTIDPHLIEETFNSPFTCNVIFRELTSLSKHIISRILFIDETVRKSLIKSWVNKDYNEMFEMSLTELNDLRIFTSVSNGPQGECMRLNRKFQENLKYSLFGGRQCDWVKEYNEMNTRPESSSILMQKAIDKWETVLSLVAGIKDINKTSNFATEVIKSAGYVSNDEITNEGFQFLLLQKKKQLWQFLICYLEFMKRQSNIIEIMQLLFHIGFGSTDQIYTCPNPSDAQLLMLKHFVDFGFISSIYKSICRQKCLFQLTPLLIDLLSGNDRLSSVEKLDQSSSIIGTQGYIIMESSDLIYATTCSKLQTAVLGMFCNVIKCFEGAVILHVSDKSIFRALEKGITSDQIIEFLRNNSHPQMKDKSIVPITLVDKIKMVEYNRKRARPTPGYMYQNFSNSAEYDVLVNHAESIGAVAWKSREKLLLVVTDDSHQSIRRFWKNRKHGDYS